MEASIQEQIHRAVKSVESLYNRLVLIVGNPCIGKTLELEIYCKSQDLKMTNVNLEMSRQLLGLTNKQRSLQVPKLFENVLSVGSKTDVLYNIEILFDVSLKQDPLRLLQNSSRNKTIIASWNGSMSGTKLIYAEPGHPEYQEYNASDLFVLNIDSENSK